jgi:hypothetical protein
MVQAIAAPKERCMNYVYSYKQWPTPGSIVSVPAYVFFRHKGIVSDRWHAGKPMVISNSDRLGHAAEEPWDAFSSGQAWQDDGYPGSLQPWQVLQRARGLMNKPYSPVSWNCDMFVSASHGFQPTSSQLAVALLIAAVSIAAIVSR